MKALSTSPTATRERCSRRRRGLGVAQRVTVELTPQAIEQIAAQVAKCLGDRGHNGRSELLSAGELAHRLRVERPWVYRHRHLLGGMRIGAGPKAPWRFDYETAVEALRDLQSESDSEERQR